MVLNRLCDTIFIQTQFEGRRPGRMSSPQIVCKSYSRRQDSKFLYSGFQKCDLDTTRGLSRVRVYRSQITFCRRNEYNPNKWIQSCLQSILKLHHFFLSRSPSFSYPKSSKSLYCRAHPAVFPGVRHSCIYFVLKIYSCENCVPKSYLCQLNAARKICVPIC